MNRQSELKENKVESSQKSEESLMKAYKKLDAQLKNTQETLREKEYIFDYQKQQLLSADDMM